MNGVALQLVGLGNASEGFGILAVGLLGLLLWAVVKFKNPAGMIMWSLSLIVLLAAGIYELGDEIFWLSLMMTTVIVAIGVSVRWMK